MDTSSNNTDDLSLEELMNAEKLLGIDENNKAEKLMVFYLLC